VATECCPSTRRRLARGAGGAHRRRLVAATVAQVMGVREEPGGPCWTRWPGAGDEAAAADSRQLRAPGAPVAAVAQALSGRAGPPSPRDEREPWASRRDRVAHADAGAPDPRILGSMRRDAIARYEAVRLFVDRAMAAQPAFALTEQNAASVAGSVTGSTASRSRSSWRGARQVLPPEKISSGSRTASGCSPRGPGRRCHATRRFARPWTGATSCCRAGAHAPQPPERLRRRLRSGGGGGGLRGGRRRRLDVLDHVTHLVDKSLVSTQEESDGTLRYALLETIREYGSERLTEAGRPMRTGSSTGPTFTRWP